MRTVHRIVRVIVFRQQDAQCCTMRPASAPVTRMHKFCKNIVLFIASLTQVGYSCQTVGSARVALDHLAGFTGNLRLLRLLAE